MDADSPSGVRSEDDPVRPSLSRGGGLVAPAIMAVNLAGYALAVTGARALAPSAFGELNALLGALLLASVPALALQAVVAQSVARRPAGEAVGPRERALLQRAAVVGAAVSAVAAVLSPAVAAFLHVGVVGPLWLAAVLLPLTVVAGAAGVLQGAERFGALAALIVAQAVAKAVALLPLLFGGDVDDVLATLAAGFVATAVAGVVAVGLVLLRSGARERGAPCQLAGMPTRRQLTLAASGLLAFLVLANLDLLLARHVLTGPASGRYSVGAVCAKVALWLPQAVVVVVFARLSDPRAAHLVLRRAVALLLGLGAIELVGAVLLARPALEVAFGARYTDVAPLMPIFVLQGALLALVQLLAYSGIATHDPVPGRLIATAAIVESTLVLAVRPATPRAVILIATVVIVALSLALLVRSCGRNPIPRSK